MKTLDQIKEECASNGIYKSYKAFIKHCIVDMCPKTLDSFIDKCMVAYNEQDSIEPKSK